MWQLWAGAVVGSELWEGESWRWTAACCFAHRPFFGCLHIHHRRSTGDAVDVTGVATGPLVGVVRAYRSEQDIGVALLRFADEHAIWRECEHAGTDSSDPCHLRLRS